jgi:hypothetical protein
MGENLAMFALLLVGEASWGGRWWHGQDTQSVNLLFLIVRGWGGL